MTSFATTVLQKMLLDSSSDEHFDVKLLVDAEGTVLRAHRVVLSMVSDVFRKIFAGGMKAHYEGVVRVSDFTSTAVSESLALIYGGELGKAKGDWQLAGQVWDFGYRFQIERVTAAGRHAALELLSQESCLRMLGFTVYIGDAEAVAQIQRFIVDEANFATVVTSADFNASSYKTIASIHRPPRGTFVDKDTATFEKLWFDALVAWANTVPYDKDQAAQEARRDAKLQRAMGLVDFSRMCTHELRQCRANKVAAECPALIAALVSVLLSRCEKMEQTVEGKGRELHELDATYKETLQRKSEAERKLRAADERMQEIVELESVKREVAEQEELERERAEQKALERERVEQEALERELAEKDAFERAEEESLLKAAVPCSDARRSFLTALEMSETDDDDAGMLRRAHSTREVVRKTKRAVTIRDASDGTRCGAGKENDTTDSKKAVSSSRRVTVDGKKVRKCTKKVARRSDGGEGQLQRASSSREGIKGRRRRSMFEPSASLTGVEDSPFLASTSGAKPPTPPLTSRRKSSPLVGRNSPPVAPQFPAPPMLLDTGRVL